MKSPLVTLAIALLSTTTVMAQNELFDTDKGVDFSITDYEFTPPQGWQVVNRGNHIFMQSPESGCQILLLEPQQSSGNLEDDAMAVFNMMYPAASWRYTHEDERKYTLSRGHLARGLRYVMVEAAMNATAADGTYHTEDGAALVIQAENWIVIAAVRHSSLLSHWDCKNRYDKWSQFFNSLDVKSVTHPKNSGLEPEKRIVGVWKLTGSGVASGEYVFAANGNFQLNGAVGGSTTTSDTYYEYIHITTYAFEGDGNYSFEGDKLILKRRSNLLPEQRKFRFEEVNHGGTGWKDRVYLLSHDPTTGELNEVCYEKQLKN